jgi:hypothetical protein
MPSKHHVSTTGLRTIEKHGILCAVVLELPIFFVRNSSPQQMQYGIGCYGLYLLRAAAVFRRSKCNFSIIASFDL